MSKKKEELAEAVSKISKMNPSAICFSFSFLKSWLHENDAMIICLKDTLEKNVCKIDNLDVKHHEFQKLEVTKIGTSLSGIPCITCLNMQTGLLECLTLHDIAMLNRNPHAKIAIHKVEFGISLGSMGDLDNTYSLKKGKICKAKERRKLQ